MIWAHVLGGLARQINSWLRKAEFQLNRTYGGRLQRLLRIEGYPPLSELLLYPISYFLVFGPTFRFRGWVAVCLVTATWAVIFLGARRFNNRRGLQAFETVIVIILSLATAWIAGSHLREAEPHVYWHVLLIVVPLMMLGLTVLPSLFAALLLRGYEHRRFDFASQLSQVELFVIPLTPLITVHELVLSVIAAPATRLLLVLFPVACFVLVVPQDYMRITAGVGLLISLLVVGLAGVNARLDAMISLLRRGLFAGGALIVSVAIIALAVARLLDWSYVATVLNSAGVLVVVSFATVCYSLVWLYDTWTSYALCRRLLSLMTTARGISVSRVDYRVLPGAIRTAVEEDGRVVQIQGGRFAVTGHFQTPTGPAEAFESYDRVQLFETIVYRAHPNRDRGELDQAYGLTDLRNRILCYSVTMDALFFASFVVAGIFLHGLEQAPTVTATMAPAAKPNLVSNRIQSLASAGDNRGRMILVSASGGGTRAALYTASVLHGLSQLDALNDVVLISGVSGGSLAAAYLAARHGELVDQQHPEVWNAYRDAMAMPYIDDVIRSCGELRVAATTRLGTVLAESFNREVSGSLACSTSLGEASIGLIFNSTLAGRSTLAGNGWNRATKVGSGSRLVLSNVGEPSTYPGRGFPGVEEERLEYVQVLDPSVCVMDAAALSANFPPVFSNALVRCADSKYWVTDGGASENRGTVSLLYVLRDALDRLAASGVPVLAHAPEIHIVIIEASAIDLNYAQDRGLGATFGASERYASQLMQELLAEISERYAKIGGNATLIKPHFLPMPMLFRGRGGLGTHWMLPAIANLKAPEGVPAGGIRSIRLNRETLKNLIFDLHDTKHQATRNSDDTNLHTAWAWIDEDDHTGKWQSTIDAVSK